MPCLLPSLDLGPTWKIQVSSKSFLISENTLLPDKVTLTVPGARSRHTCTSILLLSFPVGPHTPRAMAELCHGRKRKCYSLVTLHPFLKLPVALSEVWTATSISDLPHTFFPTHNLKQFVVIMCQAQNKKTVQTRMQPLDVCLFPACLLNSKNDVSFPL